MISVFIKKLHPDAKLPKQGHHDDFCWDVVAVSEEEVAPNVWKYGLGFAMELESKKLFTDTQRCITLRPRSSVWKTGMVLSNSIGTIDEGYRGELSMVFYHVMTDMPRYKVGDRIGQLHFEEAWRMEFTEVRELSETERGTGGYGSTGK